MPRSSVDSEVLNLGETDSTWGNLGLWSGGETRYAAACEALARRLGEAARLEPGQRILDVGSGCGDQLVLWQRAFGAAEILGIDVVTEQVELARQRIAREKLDEKVRCEAGSATEKTRFDDGSVDRVLALDCAYHFEPRADFLREAHRVLRPGGVVAWTDLALPRALGTSGQRALALACRATEIPVANVKSLAGLEQEARDAGFSSVELVRLDDDVWRGFAAFAKRHRAAYLRGFPTGAWTKLIVTGLACEQIARHQLLHYVVVTAKR